MGGKLPLINLDVPGDVDAWNTRYLPIEQQSANCPALDIDELQRIAKAAAHPPYCGDKEGLNRIMDGRISEFQSTFTPDVVVALLGWKS